MAEVIISRDVSAIAVPYGESVIIPAGTPVSIEQKLGGHFTVTWSGGMAQIRREHADALGELVVGERGPAGGDHVGPPDVDVLWSALKGVYDPEIPVNIVDLGLVYSVVVVALDDGGFGVRSAMTLTAPGCGMGPAIAQDARMRLEEVPGVSEAVVDIVWDPPWNQNMISEDGKMELGLI
ncbi:MAG: iron-sulfur cluster assembly protein [Opitutales bacterium]|jgi:probable FeS assembly SUF system protein SufT